MIRAVCIFCGAKPGLSPAYAELARASGRAIARRGWRIVYGGGSVGLMGEVAAAALEAGGEVVGIIPEILMRLEVGKRDVTRLEVVADMATRKERMIEISDAFIALPGGLGTLDELFEVLTLRQIGFHHKPVGLLNHDGYFEGLLAMCAGFVAEGFVRPGDLDHLMVEPEIEALLARLAG